MFLRLSLKEHEIHSPSDIKIHFIKVDHKANLVENLPVCVNIDICRKLTVILMY